MDYLKSLEKAIAYIEEHIDEEISTAAIARTAGYSLYHLTRIFSAVIGEPIGSYIQKRRLSNACSKLLYSDKRIIDIAVESGFGSSEAFSRAFKTAYNVSPIQYRKNNLNLYTGTKNVLDRESLLHLAGRITLKPRIIEMEKITIAGIRGQTSIHCNILPVLWGNLNQISRQLSLPAGTRGFGICETDRSQVCIEEDGNIRFSEMVGIEINNSHTIPAALVHKEIPGGKYAVFTHKGPVKTLLKTYDYIWGSWILFTKEVLDEREDLEVYDERFLGPDHKDSQIDIYIPVK